ncbi:MAG TPA: efflux RND transporter periplasmic adaptor subunit [Candidatus Kapabacteria bacterium]|nr:efflux RND transporter periplasmic adaptor subunit [Candidatus Kapabacteria bacterium]
MKHIITVIGIILIGAGALLVQSCSNNDPAPEKLNANDAPAKVTNNGAEITFGIQSPQLQQIATDTVRKESMSLVVSAPAHVLVSVVHSETGNVSLNLFESQDITQLYSDYVKSTSTLEHSSKALERVRDLYSHQIAAGRDLQDAEADHAQAQADLADKESRLRAAGIDPAILRTTPAGSVWAVAELPETQLSFIKLNAKATLECNSYPGESFEGHVSSIGDVIDPNTRTVKVRIVLANHNDKLRPGMYATARFEEGRTEAVSVPRSAVVNVEGKAFVFTQMAPGTFERTEVHIGAETQDKDVVDTGLKPDDIVATSGVILLKGLSFGY